MSYRAIKRMLGETSLERKCRLLFGSGLMLLVTISFTFHGWLNGRLVYEQNRETGRQLIAPILIEKHWKWSEESDQFRMVLDSFLRESKPAVMWQGLESANGADSAAPQPNEYKWAIIKYRQEPDRTTGKTEHEPSDQTEYDVLHELAQGKAEVVRFQRESNEYQYYGALRAANSCYRCHAVDRGEKLAQGDLMGMVKVVFPLAQTERALALNYAILIAEAIITTAVAMAGLYAIVRYVIVKPVLHLKDVSDAIARGNLDQRADIRTGDEYEELSHAFNRMLRHFVQAQGDLQHLNTDLDRKVDELAQANMRLYELNNLKNDFLATMTHELRTPLNSILGFSDVLAGISTLDEKQQRYVRNIQSSGKDLLVLVNDILDLAKIEAGKMDLHLTDVQVSDLIERLVGMMRPLAEKRNIDISTEIDIELPLLKQDGGKLQQILYNLISNAIKFTPEGGRVVVSARREGAERVKLIVEDTGVGIALDEQATIFEKFRQGNVGRGRQGSLTREYAGTGLGLSIVKELTKLLNGDVSVESEMGKGSLFIVSIPITLRDTPKPLSDVLNRSDEAVLRRLDAHRELVKSQSTPVANL